jgi:hypothetical protein
MRAKSSLPYSVDAVYLYQAKHVFFIWAIYGTDKLRGRTEAITSTVPFTLRGPNFQGFSSDIRSLSSLTLASSGVSFPSSPSNLLPWLASDMISPAKPLPYECHPANRTFPVGAICPPLRAAVPTMSRATPAAARAADYPSQGVGTRCLCFAGTAGGWTPGHDWTLPRQTAMRCEVLHTMRFSFGRATYDWPIRLGNLSPISRFNAASPTRSAKRYRGRRRPRRNLWPRAGWSCSGCC